MARFYFDIHGYEAVVTDAVGADFVNWGEALKNAIQSARDVMSHSVIAGVATLSLEIVLLDGRRDEIARVPVSNAVTFSGLKAV